MRAPLYYLRLFEDDGFTPLRQDNLADWDNEAERIFALLNRSLATRMGAVEYKRYRVYQYQLLSCPCVRALS